LCGLGLLFHVILFFLQDIAKSCFVIVSPLITQKVIQFFSPMGMVNLSRSSFNLAFSSIIFAWSREELEELGMSYLVNWIWSCSCDLVRMKCSLFKALCALSRSYKSLTSLLCPTPNSTFSF
jgi:hypothetical protein